MHLLYILLSACTLFVHDYYVGLTEIRYNKDNQSLETSIRIFTDDLEYALLESTKKKMYLDTDRQHEQADFYVEQYLRKHVAFSVNGKEKDYVYLGSEYGKDVIWLYVEVPKVKKMKSLTFKNALLTDYFKKQQNMVDTEILGKKKGAILRKGQTSFEIPY